MWFHLYVSEKLRALEEERLARINAAELKKLTPQKPPVLGSLAALTGRSLQRLGEALELWATPPSEREVSRVALARDHRFD